MPKSGWTGQVAQCVRCALPLRRRIGAVATPRCPSGGLWLQLSAHRVGPFRGRRTSEWPTAANLLSRASTSRIRLPVRSQSSPRRRRHMHVHRVCNADDRARPRRSSHLLQNGDAGTSLDEAQCPRRKFISGLLAEYVQVLPTTCLEVSTQRESKLQRRLPRRGVGRAVTPERRGRPTRNQSVCTALCRNLNRYVPNIGRTWEYSSLST